MNLNLSIKNTSKESLFLVFVIVGYVFASGLALPLGIENSRIFALPYRLLIALFSLYFIFQGFSKKKILNISVIFTILFWIFYFFKAKYSFENDIYESKVLGVVNEIYVRFLVIGLLPSLGLMLLDYSKVDLKNVSISIFWILLWMLLINVIYGFFHFENGRTKHIFSIYYISYGHLGTSLLLTSLYLLLFNQFKGKDKRILIFGALMGLYIIVEGFARSPFLALVICVAFLLVLKGKLKYLIIFATIMLLTVSLIYFSVNSGYNRLIFFDRTYNWIFNGDNSLRTPLFERGIEIFKQNPLLGGRVLYEDGMYPHNIFIELLMATGILGFVMYFARFVPLLKAKKYFFKRDEGNFQIHIFVLFLQYFVLVLTSYTLFSTPEFIHLSAIVIGLSLYKINEKTKSNDGGRNPSRDY